MKFAAKLFLLYEKSVQHKKACEAGTKENKTKGFFKEEKIMVVVLKPDTKEEQIENLKVWLSSMGISTHISHRWSGWRYLCGRYGSGQSVGYR